MSEVVVVVIVVVVVVVKSFNVVSSVMFTKFSIIKLLQSELMLLQRDKFSILPGSNENPPDEKCLINPSISNRFGFRGNSGGSDGDGDGDFIGATTVDILAL